MSLSNEEVMNIADKATLWCPLFVIAGVTVVRAVAEISKMNRKTEAEKLATQIEKVFAKLENLSVLDRSRAFELAAQCLERRKFYPFAVGYADACKALADAQWLQLFDPRIKSRKESNV